MSLTIDRTDNTTVVLDTDTNNFTIFTGPVRVEGDLSEVLIHDSSNSMRLKSSSISLINGVAPSGILATFIGQLQLAFPSAASGAALNFPAFSAYNGTDLWDGSDKEFTLTDDIDIVTTQAPRIGGRFMFHQDGTGGHQPTLNGTNLPVTLTANATTIIQLNQTVTNSLFGIKDTTYFAIAAPPPPDVTAPTIVSMEATGVNTIVMTLSENGTGTVTGIIIKINTVTTAISRAGNGTDTWPLTTTNPMVNGDTITYEIISSDIVDDSGNALADVTPAQTVTNSIGAAFTDLTFSTQSGTITESPAHFFTFGSAFAHMKADQVLPGDGAVIAEVTASISDGCYMSLDHKSANDDYTGPQDVFIMTYTALYYINEGAYSPVSTGITRNIGDLYGLFRTGSTITAKYSSDSGATWNVLHIFSGSYSATMYIKPGDVGGAGSGTIINPKGTGVV